MSNANVVVDSQTTIIRSVVQADAEEEFMRTFVSQYFLPKKIVQARKRGAVKMPVPVETLEALILAVRKSRLKGTKSVSVGIDTIESYLNELNEKRAA